MVDALAYCADEGRGTLRKATIRCVQPLPVVDVRMGKPAWGHAHASYGEHIVIGREPGELKHLSNPRKRKHSVSSGERTRISPNQQFAGVVGRA